MNSFETLLTHIKQTYEVIEPSEVYYTLKTVKLPRITPQTRDTLRWCLAIQAQGYVITVDLLSYFTGRSSVATTLTLHRLGDNNILTLVKDTGRRLRYIIHPRIIEHLDLEAIRQRLQNQQLLPVSPVSPKYPIYRHSEE